MQNIPPYRPNQTTRHHNGSRAFQCPNLQCGRRFNRKYTLNEHMKTHTGERPHTCRARGCGKRFSTSGNLSRHMRIHGAVEPVLCPFSGCSSKFMSDIKLVKHMHSHYVPLSHTCNVPDCGKSFSTTGNLNRHMKIHHTEQERRRYKAPILALSSLSSFCTSPTNQKCSTPTQESPTSIDQWTDKAWELVSEPIEMLLPAPFQTACTTPWTPEMLDILSQMLFD